VEMFRSN